MAVLVTNKVDSKPKSITNNENGHSIIIKRSVHQKDLTVINVPSPNNRDLKCTKQTLREKYGKIDNSTHGMKFQLPSIQLLRTLRGKK